MPLGRRPEGAAPISTRRVYLDTATPALSEDGKRFVLVGLNAKSLDGRGFRLGEPQLRKILSSVHAQKNDMPFMYAHGKDPVKGQRAAGWFKPRDVNFVPGEGLSLEKEKAEWTPTAKKELDDKEWGFFSPALDAFELTPNDFDPFGMVEVTLTNIPVLDGQQRIAADRDGGTTMDLKKFTKLAGVAEDATEEQILAGLEKKLTPEPVKGTGDLTEAQVTVLADRVSKAMGLDKLGDKLAERAENLVKADRKAARVEVLLDRAMKNGKITAAERKVTVDGKEVDPIRLWCENNPDAFEAWEKTASRKSPVAGTFPASDPLTDALADDEKKPGAFSSSDLANPKVRTRLHQAALARVVDKKAPDYATATLELTRAN